MCPSAHKWPNNYKSVFLASVKYSLIIFCLGQDVRDLLRRITSVLTFPCLQQCIYMVALFFVGPSSFMNLLIVCGTPDSLKLTLEKDEQVYPEYRTREDTARDQSPPEHWTNGWVNRAHRVCWTLWPLMFQSRHLTFLISSSKCIPRSFSWPLYPH